jgi:hypothetical protein
MMKFKNPFPECSLGEKRRRKGGGRGGKRGRGGGGKGKRKGKEHTGDSDILGIACTNTGGSYGGYGRI